MDLAKFVLDTATAMNRAVAMQLQSEPQFKHTECDHPVGLTAMLEANAHDEDVCEWLRDAKVGDVTYFGGQGCVECRRIA